MLKTRKVLTGILAVLVIGIAGIWAWQSGVLAPQNAVKVCLDAGHGGDDVGAVYKGRYEKDDNLRLTLAVGVILEENGVDVIYTRTEDTTVALEDRAAFANKKNASYFVSIHRNSADVDVSGVEAWIKNTATIHEESLAQDIVDAVAEVGFGDNRGVKRGYQGNASANYLVNSQTQMPSCLLEMGFITTEKDNELFDNNLDEYAAAIAEGIMKNIEVE